MPITTTTNTQASSMPAIMTGRDSTLQTERRSLLKAINGLNGQIGEEKMVWANKPCTGPLWEAARTKLYSAERHRLEKTAELAEIEVTLACTDRGVSQFDQQSGFPTSLNNYRTLGDRLLPYHTHSKPHPVCSNYPRTPSDDAGFTVGDLTRSDHIHEGETSSRAIKRLNRVLKADRLKLGSNREPMSELWGAIRPNGGSTRARARNLWPIKTQAQRTKIEKDRHTLVASNNAIHRHMCHTRAAIAQLRRRSCFNIESLKESPEINARRRLQDKLWSDTFHDTLYRNQGFAIDRETQRMTRAFRASARRSNMLKIQELKEKRVKTFRAINGTTVRAVASSPPSTSGATTSSPSGRHSTIHHRETCSVGQVSHIQQSLDREAAEATVRSILNNPCLSDQSKAAQIVSAIDPHGTLAAPKATAYGCGGSSEWRPDVGTARTACV